MNICNVRFSASEFQALVLISCIRRENRRIIFEMEMLSRRIYGPEENLRNWEKCSKHNYTRINRRTFSYNT